MKSKRTVTVDSSPCPDEDKPSRRPSVFDRLGPGAVASSSKDKYSDRQEKCRNWLRTGECAYGNLCKYEHRPISKSNQDKKGDSEYRKKSKIGKDILSRSPSPPAKYQKREKSSILSAAFRTKADYENKLRSTIVKPKSPDNEKYSMTGSDKKNRKNKKEVIKKPLEQQWEEDEQDDSDDWDATNLDYKEALTLERKRQELQRELEEMELERDEALNKEIANDDMGHVVISKKVASSSSSSSSSSRSSSASSSSGSSSSSSSGSDSGSDSDSSDSNSSSGARNKKRRKVAQSPSPHRRKAKHSAYNKSKAKKSSKGPRTPSPSKSKKSRGSEYKAVDDPRSEERGRPKKSDNYKSRYSVSPPNSYASSEATSKDQGHRGDKRAQKAKGSSISPNRSYTKHDQSYGSRSQHQSYSSSQKQSRQLSPSRDKYSRAEGDHSRRNLSPASYSSRSKDTRQRSLTPKGDGRRYDRKRSASPSKSRTGSGYHDYRSKDKNDKPGRDDTRRAEYSPGRGRSHDAKSARYQGYYEDTELRRTRSSQSPNQSRKDFRDAPRDRTPHSDRDLHVDKRKDKALDGRDYRDNKRHDYDDKFLPRSDRMYPESEYHRGSGRDRDYITDSHRSHEFEYPSRDAALRFDDISNIEREFSRTQFSELEYYTDSREYMFTGPRETIGRYGGGRLIGYDLSQHERLLDRYSPGSRERVDERGCYEQLVHRAEELDRRPRRRQRPDPFEYESSIPYQGMGFLRYSPQNVNERDTRDPYYGSNRRSGRDLPNSSNKRRQDMQPSDWNSPDYRSKRHHGVDVDAHSKRNRPHLEEKNRSSRRDRDIDEHRPDDRHDRYNSKRGRSTSQDRHAEAADKRAKESQDDRTSRSRRSDTRPSSRSTRVDSPESSEKSSRAESLDGRSRNRQKHDADSGQKHAEGRSQSRHDSSERGSVKDGIEKSDKGDVENNKKDEADDNKEEEDGEIGKEQDEQDIDASVDTLAESESEDVKKSSAVDAKTDAESAAEDEERVIDSYKGSGSEEKEEELSEWSDGDDELLTRDEIVAQSNEEQVAKEKQEAPKEDAKSAVNEAPKTKRVEEIKAEQRSSSNDRKRRSMSSERSDESRSRKRARVDDSRYGRERSDSRGSVASSQNTDTFDKADKNADNFDYDPISDDEFEAMIEEPSEAADNQEQDKSPAKKPGIVDALDIDWESLMGNKENVASQPTKTKSSDRLKPGTFFAELGYSAHMVSPEVALAINRACNEQLRPGLKKYGKETEEAVIFEFRHHVAALHATAVAQQKEREKILTDIGPYRRALCARQDLKIRRRLCRFHYRLPDHLTTPITAPANNNADPELFKLSVQLFKDSWKKPDIVF